METDFAFPQTQPLESTENRGAEIRYLSPLSSPLHFCLGLPNVRTVTGRTRVSSLKNEGYKNNLSDNAFYKYSRNLQ